MKTYIRIQNGICFEAVSTDLDIATIYHPSLEWIDITDITPTPSVGWTYSNGVFTEAEADVSLNILVTVDSSNTTTDETDSAASGTESDSGETTTSDAGSE